MLGLLCQNRSQNMPSGLLRSSGKCAMSTFEPPLLDGPESNHLYISYDNTSSSDSGIAGFLRKFLTAIGLKVRLREPHDPNTDEEDVSEAIECSQKVIAIATKSYLENPQLQEELHKAMVFAEEVQEPGRLLIVHRTDESLGNYPELSKYVQLKFTDADFQSNLRKFVFQDTQCEKTVLPTGQLAWPLAWSYFYGFLNLVLPERKKKSGKATIKESIHDRIRNYAHFDKKTEKRNMPLKMFIIIPESCFCPPKLEVPGISHTETYINCSTSRAGNLHRDYKSSVYKITDDEDGKEYYFIAEYAAPVLCMYEMAKDPEVGLDEGEMRHNGRMFYYALRAILNQGTESRRRVFKDKYKIVFLRDSEVEQKDLRKIFLPLIKEEIQNDLNREIEEHLTEIKDVYTPEPDLTGEKNLEDIRSDTSIPSTGPHVAAQLELALVPTYPMTRDPRGIALILSVEHFQKSLNLKDRTGAGKDVDALKEIFTKMKFEPVVKRDLTADGIYTELSRYSRMDHSNYDTFICVVLTHGKVGVVLGADGKEVKITEMTRRFSPKYCPSLTGKPKIFFIQACQGSRHSSDPDADAPSRSTRLNRDGATMLLKDADSIQDADFFEDDSSDDDLDLDLENGPIGADAAPERSLSPRGVTPKTSIEELTASPVAVLHLSEGSHQGQGEEGRSCGEEGQSSPAPGGDVPSSDYTSLRILDQSLVSNVSIGGESQDVVRDKVQGQRGQGEGDRIGQGEGEIGESQIQTSFKGQDQGQGEGSKGQGQSSVEGQGEGGEDKVDGHAQHGAEGQRSNTGQGRSSQQQTRSNHRHRSNRPDTLIPADEDFFMGYATLPGSLSYRYLDTGSLYIQELCKELNTYAGSLYLDAILDRVTNQVKDKLKNLVKEIQQSTPTYRLKKNQIPFYFKTGARKVVLNSSH